jgi:antitoxin MazE
MPMRSQLRKIGNSRGIIIPAALLETCALVDEVDLRVEGKTLVIEAAKTLRSTWFDGYDPLADSALLEDLPQDDALEDWEW